MSPPTSEENKESDTLRTASGGGPDEQGYGFGGARNNAGDAATVTPGAITRGLLEVREEEGDLACRRLGRVGAVHEVLAHLDREVAPDRARSRITRVGDAHHRAHHLEGVLRPLHHERHERAARDEADELTEERLALVLGVVRLGGRRVERAELHRDDREVLGLDAPDDLAGEAALDGVRLAEDEGAVGHRRRRLCGAVRRDHTRAGCTAGVSPFAQTIARSLAALAPVRTRSVATPPPCFANAPPLTGRGGV